MTGRASAVLLESSVSLLGTGVTLLGFGDTTGPLQQERAVMRALEYSGRVYVHACNGALLT